MNYYQLADVKDEPELAVLFEACREAVINKEAKYQRQIWVGGEIAEVSCFRLASGQLLLCADVVEYVLQKWEKDSHRASYEEVKTFCEQARKMASWDVIATPIEQWFYRNLRNPYFDDKMIRPDSWHWDYVLKSDVELERINKEVLNFGIYVALSFLCYGLGTKRHIGEAMMSYMGDLAKDKVYHIEQYGTGRLPKELIYIHNELFSIRVNDATGVIKMQVYQECEESYRRLLELLNQVLAADFPESYCIYFQSRQKGQIAVRGLLKHGIYRFFANAVTYQNLWELIEKYIRQVMRKGAWYTDFSNEEAVMPGTFALFALLDNDIKYLPLVRDYMAVCDRRLSSVQAKFTLYILEKFGITAETLPVIIDCICAYEKHRSSSILGKSFATKQSLQLLIEVKHHLSEYLPKDDLAEYLFLFPPEEQEKAKLLYAEKMWDHIIGVIFGKTIPKRRYEIINYIPIELRKEFEALLIEPLALAD